MRSEHVFLTILALVAIIVYLLTKAAGIDPPPDDTEPTVEVTPDYVEPDLVLLPREDISA